MKLIFEILNIRNLIKDLNRSESNIVTVSSKKLHIYIICNNTFAQKQVLIKHVNENYNSQRSFHYNTCEKKFKRDNYLQKHFVIHIKNFNTILKRITINQKT